jgi:hypothetical protein
MAIPTAVQDDSGDIEGVGGTKATVILETDVPLTRGLMVFDDGSELAFENDGRSARATFTLDEKSERRSYYIASREPDGLIRMTEDYFIRVRPETPPTLRVSRPGRDARVSPIEELTIAVNAEDDYGLEALTLHYSVNGGEEKTKALPSQSRRKTLNRKPCSTSKTTIWCRATSSRTTSAPGMRGTP